MAMMGNIFILVYEKTLNLAKIYILPQALLLVIMIKAKVKNLVMI